MLEITYETLLDKSVVRVRLMSFKDRVIKVVGTQQYVYHVYGAGNTRKEIFLGKLLREVNV